MGHAIGGGLLEAKTREAAMKEGLADAEDFAYYNGDRYEGSDEYHGDFRFYNKTFNTVEEAERFFDDLGAYCDGVCMIKSVSPSIQAKYDDKVSKIHQKQKAYKQWIVDRFKTRTSKSVGCRKCGARIQS